MGTPAYSHIRSRVRAGRRALDCTILTGREADIPTRRRRRGRRRAIHRSRGPSWAASAQTGPSSTRVTGWWAPRSSRMTSPRTCRSEPANFACTARLGPSIRRIAGATPSARPGDRALVAARGSCGAHRGAEFHRRRVHDAGRGRVIGQQSLHRGEVAGRRRRPGVGLPRDGAGEHASRVRVDHRMSQAERERGDGASRVGADALQREERVEIAWHLAAVPLDDLGRGPVQPQRAPRVAQPIPCTHGFGGRLGGERRRSRPPCDPRLPSRDDPADLRLLQHELAHEHRPRRRRRPHATAAVARRARTSR